jgi:poly(3-hydroxybutyrate) depolymerase
MKSVGLSEDIELDEKHLTITGHSVGGATVINAAHKISEIKAAIGLDSAYQLIKDDIDAKMLDNTPFLEIRASTCLDQSQNG